MIFLKKKILYSACFFILTLLLLCSSVPQIYADADRVSSDDSGFFSYRRFLLDTKSIDAMSATSGTGRDLKKFVKDLTDGVYLISGGQNEKAREKFFAARKLWPEYFGTDFLIAMAYEGSGDIDTAARFYKSYLIKLRDFHNGKNRISAPIIRFLSRGEIERYSPAEKLVEGHLADLGVQLSAVRPAPVTANLLVYFVVLLLLIAGYLAITYVLVPRLKRRRRRKLVPEGFWLCEHCGVLSPELSNVCVECRKPRL